LEEKADLFIPVSKVIYSVFDAEMINYLPKRCKSTSLGKWTIALDDKVSFINMAKLAGLTVPDTVRMISKSDIVEFNNKLIERAEGVNNINYILKSLKFDAIRRLDCFKLPSKQSDLLN